MPSLSSRRSSTSRRHQLGPAEGTCEAQRQQRPIPLAREGVRASASASRPRSRLSRRPSAFGAVPIRLRMPFAAACTASLSVGSGCLRELVCIADRSAAAADGGCRPPRLSLMDEEARDRLGRGRHGSEAEPGAPRLEQRRIAAVGPHGRLGLGGALVGPDESRGLGWGVMASRRQSLEERSRPVTPVRAHRKQQPCHREGADGCEQRPAHREQVVAQFGEVEDREADKASDGSDPKQETRASIHHPAPPRLSGSLMSRVSSIVFRGEDLALFCQAHVGFVRLLFLQSAMLREQPPHRPVGIRAIGWLGRVRATALNGLVGLLIDRGPVCWAERGEISETEFMRDLRGDLLPLRMQSQNARLCLICPLLTPHLPRERAAPADREERAAQPHPIRDADQYELPVLRAEVSECLVEAKVVSRELGGVDPLRRQVVLLGRDVNDRRVRHAEPLPVNSDDTNAARYGVISIAGRLTPPLQAPDRR